MGTRAWWHQTKHLGLRQLRRPQRVRICIQVSSNRRHLKPSWSGRIVRDTVLAAWDGHGFEPQTSTNACRQVCKYVDQKRSAAMLTSIQVAGESENHAGKKTYKGYTLALKNPGQTPPVVQTGVSVAPRKGHVLQIFSQKKGS